MTQSIHMDDLARTVCLAVEQPALARTTLEPVGPQTVTLAQIVRSWRSWLGLPPQREISIPKQIVRLAGRFGDLGGDGPLSTVALKQLDYGNVGDPAAFETAIGFKPMGMEEALQTYPATVQDKWHARLYALRPLLRLGLAGLWIASGLIGLLAPAETVSRIALSMGLEAETGRVIGWASCLADVLIGIGLLARSRTPLLLAGQLFLILGYTAVLSYAAAGLWLDPFGPLAKNLAVLLLVLIWAALEDDR